MHRAGTLIDLSPTEFKLLRYLMLNPNRVLSKSQILDHVWAYDFNGEAGIVESYISYLRRKIDAVEPPLIHTKRGVGYVLRLPRRHEHRARQAAAAHPPGRHPPGRSGRRTRGDRLAYRPAARVPRRQVDSSSTAT